MRLSPLVALAAAMLCTPLAARAQAADCDRLAALAEAPRPAGTGVVHVLDPEGAVRACEEAVAADPVDSWLRAQLARAYRAAEPRDPRALALIDGLDATLPALARGDWTV